MYLAIALSGAGALGAEVVWTRLLGLMLGATVYTFAIILAVFLVGLGIGSAVGAALLRNVRPRSALGACQLLLVLAACLVRVSDRPVSSVLAHQPVPLRQPVVHPPTRYGALRLGRAAGGAAVGSQLPIRPGGGRAGRRPGTPGGPRLRRQHRRRHCWAP